MDSLQKTLSPYLRWSLFLHISVLLLLFVFYKDTPKIEKRRVVHVSTVKLKGGMVETSPSTAEVEKEIAPPPPPPPEAPKEPQALAPVSAPPLSVPTPPPAPKVEKKKEEKKPAPPKEKEKPKKEVPKKEVSKKEEPKVEPKKEPPKADPKKEALLKEARASLAKMGKGEATSLEASRSSLKPLTSLKSEDGLFSLKGGENDLYSGELIKRLKLALRLPESGEVLVDVTLQRNGRVAKVNIRESKSSVNRTYVQSTLPSVNFPSFGEFYPHDDEKLFTLSLQNAIY